MSKRKKDNTDAPVPMTSGSIDELDRLRLSELNSAVLVQRNAVVALDAEMGRLQSQAELVQLRKKEATQVGREKQEALIALGAEIRSRYGIPPTHDVKIADGSIFEKPAQEGTGAPVPAMVSAMTDPPQTE